MINKSPITLPPSFYEQPALQVAPRLLGHILVRRTDAGDIRCRIVETESYGGVEDKGSHAFNGRRTARTEVMFGPGGTAYVYLIYGMYHCLNVVTGAIGDPQAVLIRAVEPLTSADEAIMRQYRGTKAAKPIDLSGGPGKLCRALLIDKSLNGQLLIVPNSSLWIEAGETITADAIQQSPRINIAYAQEYAEKPWRYFIRNSRYVPKLTKNISPYQGEL